MTARVRLKDLPPAMRKQAQALKREAVFEEREAFRAYCEKSGLPAPTPEFRFSDRLWRFDFAWEGSEWTGTPKVALEIDGAAWGTGKPCPTCKQRRAGRHTSGAGFLGDIEKLNAAALAGWKVLRCTPTDLYTPATLDLLRRALAA